MSFTCGLFLTFQIGGILAATAGMYLMSGAVAPVLVTAAAGAAAAGTGAAAGVMQDRIISKEE